MKKLDKYEMRRKSRFTTTVALIASATYIVLELVNGHTTWLSAITAASFGWAAALSWAMRDLWQLEDLYDESKELAYDTGYLKGQMAANHDIQWAAETLADLRDMYPLADSEELAEMLQQRAKERDIGGA